MICDKSVALNNEMTMNNLSRLQMSEVEKEKTYQAAVAAMTIISQRREALNEYRREIYSNLDKYEGSFSFTFNMDFMKVTNKLISGYVRNGYANSQMRKSQVSAESLKIAKETGASFQEVRGLFLLLMNRYIHV